MPATITLPTDVLVIIGCAVAMLGVGSWIIHIVFKADR